MTNGLCSCGSKKSHTSAQCQGCEFAKRGAARVARQTRTCVGCGTQFLKKPNRNAGKYCSRACAFLCPTRRAQLTTQILAARPIVDACKSFSAVAEKAIRAAIRSMRPISKVVNDEVQHRKYTDWVSKKKDDRLVIRLARSQITCKACGTAFVPVQGSRIYCTELCARRTSKRVDKGIRRARTKGAAVERVDPLVVFKRDGWRCQMCWRKTRKVHGNTADSPELDHIVPLSLGGAHSYVNTQLLCRSCNGRKGARAQGQLRLCS